jgi:hypothetical protein
MSDSVLKSFLENVTGVTGILNFSEKPDAFRIEVV